MIERLQIMPQYPSLQTVAVDRASSAQLISLLDAIRISLPQFRTNLDGLTRLLRCSFFPDLDSLSLLTRTLKCT